MASSNGSILPGLYRVQESLSTSHAPGPSPGAEPVCEVLPTQTPKLGRDGVPSESDWRKPGVRIIWGGLELEVDEEANGFHLYADGKYYLGHIDYKIPWSVRQIQWETFHTLAMRILLGYIPERRRQKMKKER